MATGRARDLCGRWRPPDSAVVVEIRASGDEWIVSAVDSDDGEVLEVSDVHQAGDVISFTMVTPSTRWTVHVDLELRDDGSLAASTTLYERWERANG